MNEIITTLATEPSVEEWRCIREFKRRTRELAENSLLRNGYDLSANMSWKAGEPSSYTVKATARATGLQAGNQLLRDCHAHIICASFMEDSMSSIHFDTSAPKKATNLSINSDLLRQAKELHINLSQTVEDYLADLVREAKQKQWLAENAEFIAAYNRRIEKEGVFSDGLRRF